MPKIPDIKEVSYLALEGGGGKGVTYLGAIRALDELGVLPIDITRPGRNQIKGISGSSAGAITALMLAMGLSTKNIEEILSRSQDFIDFFDDPAVGITRLVDQNNIPGLHTDATRGISSFEQIRGRADSIKMIKNAVRTISYVLKSLRKGENVPMARKLMQHPEQYAYNLIFDRGIFPGISVRKFLHRKITEYLGMKLHKHHNTTGAFRSYDGSEVNFEVFYEFTGVDLVITGANVTQHKPAIFSRRHTPKFPVAEAVGISMNLPLIFKPIKVEANVPPGKYNMATNDYHGFWVDGGLLNNFPLHAFDYLMPPVSEKYPHLRPLNPAVLGLRLTEGPPGNQCGKKKDGGTFDILLSHFGMVFNTLMYPSEAGQIRTTDEAEQTIDLYTYCLETTDFAPSASLKEEPIKNAEREVQRYFGK